MVILIDSLILCLDNTYLSVCDKTVSLIETVYMLHFYLAGKTLSCNQLKSCETKVKMEKEKD